MSRPNSKLEELAKMIKQNKKKEKFPLPKPQARSPTTIGPKKVSRDQAFINKMEEKKRVDFFKKLQKNLDNMDADEITAVLTDFGEKGDDNRKIFVYGIVNSLSPKMFKQFIDKVIRGERTSQELFDDIRKISPVTKGEKIRAMNMNEAVKEKGDELRLDYFLKILDAKKLESRVTGYDIFASMIRSQTGDAARWNNMSPDEQSRIIQEEWSRLPISSPNPDDTNTQEYYRGLALDMNKETQQKRQAGKKTIKTLSYDKEGNLLNEEDLKIYKNAMAADGKTYDSQTLYDYMRHLWIPDYEATYITQAIGSDVIDSKYIIQSGKPSDSITYEGRLWYKPSKYFYLTQIGNLEHKRTQEGVVLTSYETKDKPVRLNVLFITKNGDKIIQNEKIFNNEKTWFRKKSMSNEARLVDFENTPIKSLSSSVKSEISGWIRRYIASTLSVELSNQKRDDANKLDPADMKDPVFLENDSFITELEQTFMLQSEDKTIGYYIELVSTFLVFVQTKYTGQSYKIFRSRLRSNFYNPSKIPSISIEEKVPEIFANPDNTNLIDGFKIIAASIIKSEKNIILTFLFNFIHPHHYISAIPYAYKMFPNISSQTGKKIAEIHKCEGNIYPHENIFYTEKDVTYCFSIVDLISRFAEGDFTNPKTGSKLSDTFIDSIVSFNNQSVFDVRTGLYDTEEAPRVSILKADISSQDYPMIDRLMAKIEELESSLYNIEKEPLQIPMESSENVENQEVIAKDEEKEEKEDKKEEEVKTSFGMRMHENAHRCKTCGKEIEGEGERSVDKDGETALFCGTDCMGKYEF